MPPSRVVAIYNADGGIVGELRYVVGKLRGRVACSLCDITHGHRLTAKPAWQELLDGLDAPLEVRHRNEATDVPWAEHGALPMVLAETREGWRLLLGSTELDALHGDVDRFGRQLHARLDAL